MSIFSRIPIKRPKKSVFNLTHDHKYSCNFGELIPVNCMPVVPGDKISCNSEFFVRMAPMVAPVMHNIDVYVHHFFVPNRILCERKYYENLMTGGKNGTENPLLPQFDFRSLAQRAYGTGQNDYAKALTPGGFLRYGSLADYLGYKVGWTEADETLPIWSGVKPSGTRRIDEFFYPCNALPFLAYRRIYDDYYRDENFEDEWPYYDQVTDQFIRGAGIDSYASDEVFNAVMQLLNLRTRCWKKDYFTSALPNPQRGVDVTLSLGESAPVVAKHTGDRVQSISDGIAVPSLGDCYVKLNETWYKLDDIQKMGATHSANVTVRNNPDDEYTGFRMLENLQFNNKTYQNVPLYVYNKESTQYIPAQNIAELLQTDLRNATAVTINDLRRAERLQQWFENNARAGYRYIEQIASHFGVRSSDARLQRAEYLGGGKIPVQISDVLQTSAGQADSAQGNMSGRGIAAGDGGFKKKFIEEHGYIISIASILPRTDYMCGINRDLMKQDRYDLYWPEFAHLGEQEIYNAELFLTANPREVFGYTPRYAEYKFLPNKVSGEFATPLLDEWHLARNYAAVPKLNNDFVHCNQGLHGLDRIFAVTDEEASNKFYVYNLNKIKAVRPMPYFGVPTL